MSFAVTVNELSTLIESRDVQQLNDLGGIDGLVEKVISDGREGIDSGTIEERKKEFGENFLPEKPGKNFFKLLFEALKETMLILLMVLAVISIVLGVAFDDEPEYGWIEGVAIIAAVLIVSTVTAFNDYQKDKQFRALSKESGIIPIKVLRDGSNQNVNIDQLLVGDVVILTTGDQIPADGILIEGHDLKNDESVMTGEIKPVKKDAERPFLLSGCQVAEGSGKMLIVAVGPNSEWGKTLLRLNESDDDDDQTPLEEKLDNLAKLIGKGGIIFAIATFVVLLAGFLIQKLVSKAAWTFKDVGIVVNFIVISVTIVVVAVPEGLPLAVTISLAYSVKKMMKDNNLVRKLVACETMGSATNICSDKTGTLTMNEMQVTQAYIASKVYDELPTQGDLNEHVLKLFADNASVNSSAELVKPKPDSHKQYEIQGNRTESAILIMLRNIDVDYKRIRDDFDHARSVVKVFTFSSKKKRMSTVVKVEDELQLHCKGASEIVLEMCRTELNESGESIKLDDKRKKHIKENVIEVMAKAGLRTLALAYKTLPSSTRFSDDDDEEDDRKQDEAESNLTLIAIVGIKDPLRPEVTGAVNQCKKSGIVVRMVTGDNILTAQHIARECGILDSSGVAMEGPDFRKLSDEELDEVLPKLQVLARSSPDDKYRLVSRLRALGEVVAVTGDGTNDGLALKEADVGLSMGLTGTQIAKEASDIVITDDNFSSIVKAVLWGRSIFENIRKFLTFQLTVNIVALVITIIASLTSFLLPQETTTGAKKAMDPPLTAVQLLWVNLIMDTFAALALATEPPIDELLNRKPIGRNASLFTWRMWVNIITQSVYQLIVCMTIYYLGTSKLCITNADGSVSCLAADMQTNNTIVFNVFVFCQAFNEFNCRKINMEFNILANIHKSVMFLLIFVVTAFFQVIIVEFLGRFANTRPLSLAQWGISIIIGLLCIPFSLLVRIVTRGLLLIAQKRGLVKEEEPRQVVRELEEYSQVDE
ncbi:10 TM domain-containing transmembrane protein [Acrasis kona]|uniref:Calcium-transporting ATPase n=1 Tax=Acrasis kona TaxID=1008807 RepID=A0AAW2YHX0_9EUKA